MKQDNSSDVNIPGGLEFLELIWSMEDSCEAVTDERIPNLGEKAPRCLEEIGTVLSLMDRMASCWWGCQRGDHQVEYLCGRVASNGRAALRLTRSGFYDESLRICRSMGEAANLLNLFALDKAAFEEWKSGKLRRPTNVGLRIKDIQGFTITDESRYILLSERTAHIRPGVSPQSYNVPGIPILASYFQGEGVLLCLNEVALPLAVAAIFSGRIIELEDDIKRQVTSSGISLMRQIGGVTITEIDAYHRQFSEAEQA